jgi:hypothetical protein
MAVTNSFNYVLAENFFDERDDDSVRDLLFLQNNDFVQNLPCLQNSNFVQDLIFLKNGYFVQNSLFLQGESPKPPLLWRSIFNKI